MITCLWDEYEKIMNLQYGPRNGSSSMCQRRAIWLCRTLMPRWFTLTYLSLFSMNVVSGHALLPSRIPWLTWAWRSELYNRWKCRETERNSQLFQSRRQFWKRRSFRQHNIVPRPRRSCARVCFESCIQISRRHRRSSTRLDEASSQRIDIVFRVILLY